MQSVFPITSDLTRKADRGGGVMADRPTKEDRDTLRLLLQREDLSDWEAEFVDNLRNWQGNWTPKQADKFDDIWAKYY